MSASAKSLNLLESCIESYRPDTYKLLGYEDLRALPQSLEIIENILPRHGSSCIYGASGSGKTFLALDMALSIARGDLFWFGYRVMQVPVIYVALEGVSGIANRLVAHSEGSGNIIPPTFKLTFEPFLLNDPKAVYRLIETAKEFMPGGGLIQIDTMTRAAGELDLNGPTGMGAAICAIDKISREANSMVQTIYHSTSKSNNDTATELGHSSYRGSLDASIFVHSKGASRKWISRKVKDGEDGIEHSFLLEVQGVGFNQWNEAKTSCYVVVLKDGTKAKPEIGASNLSQRTKRVFSLLEEICHRVKFDSVDQGIDHLEGAVTVDHWREAVYQSFGELKPDNQRQIFSRAKSDLLERGLIRISGIYVQLVKQA